MNVLNAKMPGNNGSGGDQGSRPGGWGFRANR